MFSIVTFIVMGVVCLLVSFNVFRIHTPNPFLDWVFFGTAALCFIGAELASIWRRTAIASESAAEALDRQTALLRSIAFNLPSAVEPTGLESEPSADEQI